jgi:predicted dehydrogenase
MASQHSKSPQDDTKAVSRRKFLGTAATAAATGASVMIVPRYVLGQGMTPPSDLVNIAAVGVTGRGASVMQGMMSQNIVAVCDVDFGLLDNRLAQWRNTAFPITGPAQPGAGGRGQGAGAGGGAAATPPQATWQNFGASKLQQTANAKWKPEPQNELIRRFVTEQIPRLARYRDYREMLEKQKDIDAVMVATPDHMHAPIASAAMSLGKHVYVEKPLCWSVHEARHLAKKAADMKVVTQMGNQGHSQDGARRGQDYLASGVLGDIREVHVWTNRPFAYWPQGVPRPSSAPGTPNWNSAGLNARLANAMAAGNYTVPDSLSWDLFLGVAPFVDYHPVYHPFNWRGWVDWGQGALGDMGAHLIDHPVWGLKLGLPTTIETLSTPFNGASYPSATTTYYDFPARQGMPAVKMIWYDGGLLPPRPEEMGDAKLDPGGGVLYIGTKGKMLQDTYGANPRLLPIAQHNSVGAPREQTPRIPNQAHEMNWVNAIRGREEVSCPFSYASHLTEIMLLGIAALRANTKLQYDGANMRVTNNVAANDYLTRQYRAGYSL